MQQPIEPRSHRAAADQNGESSMSEYDRRYGDHDEPGYHVLEVDKPFPFAPLAQDGSVFTSDTTGHKLLIQVSHPTPAEREAIEAGTGHFGVLEEHGVVRLLFCFGSLPWNNAPFSIHMVPPAGRWLPPEPEPGEGTWIHVFLVDGANHILRAMRTLSFSRDFTSVLHRLIREQAERPFDLDAHVKYCREAEERWAKPEWMLPLALARYDTDHASKTT
jgi:hypothetical protein